MSLLNPGNNHSTIASAGLAVLIVLFAIQTVSAAHHERPALDCAKAEADTGSPPQLVAERLLAQSFDTEKLACGVNLLVAIADNDAGGFDTQLAALQANARNIYFLDRIVLYELGYLIAWYVTEVPEETKTNASMIALVKAQNEQMRILQRARENRFTNVELDYFEALSIGPNAKALGLLKAVVAADPHSIKGAGHALLAETYYALPDIAGGDLDRAIGMMQAAWERDPDNPLYPRLLAGYLLDAAQADEALAVLKQLLSIETNIAGLQLMADQLRVAADLAQRIGDKGLARQLSARREATMEDHPYLQQRTVVSAMGHFGDKNPMVEE